MPTLWPEEAPILTGRDIYKGDFASSDGKRCCLYGWQNRFLGREPSKPVYGDIPNAIDSAIVRAVRVICGREIETWKIDEFNDDDNVPNSDLARVWNLAMAMLGYIEGNPETATLEKSSR